MVPNGLPERYEYFVVQENFNPAGSFVERRTRLTNYEESRIHGDYVDDVGSHVAMTSMKAKLTDKYSSKNNAPPKSISGQLTCNCCGMKGHMKSECYKRERAECTFCKQKGHLVQGCIKKATRTRPGSLTSSLKSDRASSEATEEDLVVDSGSTDHIVVNKNWFKSIGEIDATVSNPDAGNSKILRIGEVEVLAKMSKDVLSLWYWKKPFTCQDTEKTWFCIKYHRQWTQSRPWIEKCFSLTEKQGKTSNKKRKIFLFAQDRKKITTLQTWVGHQMGPSSGTNAWANWTIGTWKIPRPGI